MIIIVLAVLRLLPAFTITSKRGQIVPKNERNDAEKRVNLWRKRENDAEKRYKNWFRTKTELLYFKNLIIIVLSGYALFPAFTPLQIDSFTENKNDLSDGWKIVQKISYYIYIYNKIFLCVFTGEWWYENKTTVKL